MPTPGSGSAAASTPTIQPTWGPLSYNVEALAADDDDLDLDPAAAALSKSRQWVLTALRAGGDLQTVKGARVGERAWHDRLASSWIEASPNPP